MSKEVAKVDADVALYSTGLGRGIEDVDTVDIIKPRILLLQALSPAVADGLGKPGEFMNNISNSVYGNSMIIQPIKYFKTRIKWIPRIEGGGIECRADDGKNGTTYGSCKVCPNRNWTTETPPSCDEIHNFLSIVRGDGAMSIVIVSFSKTNWRLGKQFISKITDDIVSWKRDMFAKKYKLFSRGAQNAAGQKYFIMDTDAGELVTEDEFKQGESAFLTFQHVTMPVDYVQDEYTGVDADVSG